MLSLNHSLSNELGTKLMTVPLRSVSVMKISVKLNLLNVTRKMNVMINYFCWVFKIGWVNPISWVDSNYLESKKWVNVKTKEVRYTYHQG